MLLNQLDNQEEILPWLSERNQHIPIEDLAYLLEVRALTKTLENPLKEQGLPYPRATGAPKA